jgi:poly(A) polymerase
VLDRIRFNNHTTVGAKIAEDICGRLRFSNEKISHIVSLVLEHHRFMHVREMRRSKLVRFLRDPHFDDHLALHRIDCLACHGMLDNYHFCKNELASLEPERLRPTPLINGHDLITLGYKPGPFFKQVLMAVEDAQIEARIKSRDDALFLAKQLFDETV